MKFSLAQLHTLHLLALGLVLMFVCGLSTQTALAAANPQMNYQGKLTNASGVAVPDGTYNMRFWLSSSSTAATSSALWTESLTGTSRVQVTNGLFSVMLGSTTALTGVDFNQTLYLGVEIGGTGGSPAWDGEMSPRKILGMVPAAFVATTAVTASSANALSGIASSSFLRSDEADTMTASSSSSLLTLIQNGVGKVLSLFSGATEIFTALSNGNVGVGTTTPAMKFSVNGGSLADFFRAASTTAASTFMGPVGLGTTTPEQQLVVQGRTQFWEVGGEAPYIDLDGALSMLSSRIDFYSAGNLEASMQAATNVFTISDSNFSRVVVNDGGSVQLRNASGGAALDVTSTGDVNVANALAVSGNSSVTGTSTLATTTISNLTLGTALAGTSGGTGLSTIAANQLLIGGAGNTWSQISTSSLGLGITGGTEGFLARWTSSTSLSSSLFRDNGTVAGVNATSSSYTFNVQGSAGVNAFNVASSSGTSIFAITSNSRVGIGSTTPSHTLSVNGTASVANIIAASTTAISTIANRLDVGTTNLTHGNPGSLNIRSLGSATSIGFKNDSLGEALIAFNVIQYGLTLETYASDMPITIRPNGVTSTYFAGNGNVAIGTSSPWAELSLQGSYGAATKLFEVASTTSSQGATSSLFAILANGNVGVGSTSPAAKLGVNGLALADNFRAASTTATSTFLGPVGFGTSSPISSFVVTSNNAIFQNTSNGTSFRVNDSTGSYILAVDTSGSLVSVGGGLSASGQVSADTASFTNNVGIGSSTPSHKLTVVGNSYIGGNLRLTGALLDSTAATGTLGMVLQTTGTSTRWVATSSLGISSGASTFLALTDTPSSYTANRLFFTNSGATAVTDDADLVFDGTNLGIGTTTPTQQLSVAGNALFRNLANSSSAFEVQKANGDYVLSIDTSTTQTFFGGATFAAGGIYGRDGDASSPTFSFTNDSDTGIFGSGGSNYIGFTTGATEKMRINSAGNVGIGTTTPSHKLSVAGVANFENIIVASTTAIATIANRLDIGTSATVSNPNTLNLLGALPGITLDSTTLGEAQILYNSSYGLSLETPATQNISLRPSNTTAMTLLSGGNVGIGTTTPYAKLTVSGGLGLTGAFLDSTSATGTLGMVLQTTGTSTRWVATSTLGLSGITGSGTSGRLTKFTGTSAVGNSVLYEANSSIGLNVAPTFTGAIEAGGDYDSILDGSITIYNPNGGAGAAASLNLYNNAGRTGSLMAIGHGNTWDSNLHRNRIYLNSETAEGMTIQSEHASGSISFYTGASANERLYIAASGNIGVGTTSPWAKLAVQNSYGNTAALLDIATTTSAGNATSSLFKVLANGNVGIGNTSPSYMLHVGPAYSSSLSETQAMFAKNGSSAISVVNTAASVEAFLLANTAAVELGSMTSTPVNFVVGNDAKAVITTAGNFGIGSTTPSSLLTVAGNTYIGGSLRLTGGFLDSTAATGTLGMVLQTTGTSTRWVATSSLGISSGATTFLALTDTPSSYTANRVLFTNSGATAVTDSANFVFDGTNLGIGTTSPAARLGVNGLALADYFRAASTTATSSFEGNAVFSKAAALFGFGTTTPVSQFTINGNRSNSSNSSYLTAGTETFGVYNNNTRLLAAGLSSSGTTLVEVAGSGATLVTERILGSNAGNLTLFPGGSSGAVLIKNSNDSEENAQFLSNGRISFGTTSSSIASLFLQSKASINPFAIASSTGVSLLTLTQAGNLGIGTTSPAARLGVSGLALADNFRAASTTADSLFNGTVTIGSGSGLTSKLNVYGNGANTPAEFETSQAGLATVLTLSNSNGGGNAAALDFDVSGTTAAQIYSYDSALIFETSQANPMLFNINGSSNTAIVIDTNLNVGIGSTSPSSLLTVGGNTYIGGNLRLTGALLDSTAATGTLGMVLQTTGTSTRWVATSTLGITSSLSGGTEGFLARWTSASALGTGLFRDNGTVAGVNATSSSYTFNVQGGAGVNPFNVASSSGTSILTVTSNSRVGIGSTTPNYTLSVNGTAGVANFVAASTTAISTIANQLDIGVTALSHGNAGALNIRSVGSNTTIGFKNDTVGEAGISFNTLGFGLSLETYNSDVPINIRPNGSLGAHFDPNGNTGIGTSTLQSTRLTIDGGMSLSGALLDSTRATGTLGMVLQSTGTSTRWVATSTLGITGGAGTFLSLTDTPSSYTANRVFYTNSGATAVTDSANLTFDGSLLSVNGSISSGYFTGTSTTATSTLAAALGIGTSSPFARGLTIDRSAVNGTSTAGIGQYLAFANTSAGAQQFGNNTYIRTTNTATTTLVGNILRLEDSTTYGNTVRGFEVQTERGTNTLGENTAISGFARTFGVRGVTEGDAGGTYEPAGVYGETRGTTQGNAIRGYSSTITTASLLKLFQDTSTFTGTGLLMNFGNSGGSFSSTTASRFIDLQNAGTSRFSVGAYGMLTIGSGTSNNAGIQIGYGGLCVDNDGSCNASTTGRITSVSSATGNSDLAEMYFSNDDLEPGEVVYLKGGLSVGRASESTKDLVIGVVSTLPGLIMGENDVSLRAGEEGHPIALKGRVPVKVSNENGEVKKGDELMLSGVPGVVMKASSTGTVVGIALEDYEETRAYSDTFINQFGESIIVPDYTPINRVSDPRINDGCYFGGGSEAGDAPCVPLVSTTTEAQYDEADALALAEAKERALRALERESSDRVTTESGAEVRVGQIVMFVDLRYRYLDADGETMLAALSAQVGEEVTDTIWSRLVELANNFVDGVLSVFTLKADRVETNELCVDGVCVTADDLRTLLEGSGETPTEPEPEEEGEEVLPDTDGDTPPSGEEVEGTQGEGEEIPAEEGSEEGEVLEEETVSEEVPTEEITEEETAEPEVTEEPTVPEEPEPEVTEEVVPPSEETNP